MTEKKTVGEVALDLQKDPYPQDVIETQREMLKEYPDELIACAKRHEKMPEFQNLNHFYLCVQTKRERILTNVVRNYFYARRTRPAPTYDLSLYYYEPKDEKLTFIWCIPDKETCEYMLTYKHELPHDQWQLLDFVEKFTNNTLI